MAERFVRHNADRAAGVGHPTAEMLETVYRRLVDKAVATATTIVLGTTFIDGAEDLDWALASEDALHEHSRAIARIMAPLAPVFLYLDGDIAQAFDRAERQRGRKWFRGAPTSDAEWPSYRERWSDGVDEWAQRLLAALAAGGWELTPIDVRSLAPDDVLEQALAALRARGVQLRSTS